MSFIHFEEILIPQLHSWGIVVFIVSLVISIASEGTTTELSPGPITATSDVADIIFSCPGITAGRHLSRVGIFT